MQYWEGVEEEEYFLREACILRGTISPPPTGRTVLVGHVGYWIHSPREKRNTLG